MNYDAISLESLKPGERGRVQELKLSGPARRRLQDIGLVENASVRCLFKSPAGDPRAYLIKGAVMALRREICTQVLISKEAD